MAIADRQKPPPGELYLDHVSHFVPDLDAAAGFLEELGFTLTAPSAQTVEGRPAGASNRCIMLEEGYVELLTPTHDTPIAQRMRARMAQFVGVHLACFGTPDAEGEHARLAAHGFEPQPVVNLQRQLEGRGVRFKVVRPDPGAMPEGRVQYVEHLSPEAIWTARSLAHANGVTGLQALFVVADDAVETAARWARFTGLLPRPQGDAVELEAARGRILVGSHWLPSLAVRPALAGYALACRHPRAFVARCSELGLAVHKTAAGHAISLPPALGGVWLV